MKMLYHEKDFPSTISLKEVAHYDSLQNALPVTYGVNELGLPDHAKATRERVAMVKQLRGYLFFFEQTLSNYLEQLANVRKLFSIDKTIDRNLLTPEIKIDAKIDLKDITPKFYRILKQFAPYGPANMTPVFMTENLTDTGYGKCVGADKTHLRFTANQPDSNSIVGIGFGMGDKYELISDKKPFKAVYSIDENEFRGNVSLQLKLRDIKT